MACKVSMLAFGDRKGLGCSGSKYVYGKSVA